jgi:hypothetical protein
MSLCSYGGIALRHGDFGKRRAVPISRCPLWCVQTAILARLMPQEGFVPDRAFNGCASPRPDAAALPVAVPAVDGCARAPRRTGGPVWPVILRSRDYIGGPCRVRHTGRFGAACNIVLELASTSPAGRSSQSPHSSCGSNEPSPITASARLIKASSLSRCSSESWNSSLTGFLGLDCHR